MAESTTPHPPTREARLDGCPECVVNAELPRAVEQTPHGYIAAYLCTDCGHAWATAWKEA